MNQPLGTGIIVLRDQHILVGKRKNAYSAGSYGLPGGRVELGQSLMETAKRELYEETGLVATTIEYLGCVREFQQEKDFIHFAYVCTEFEGEPETKEPEKCEGWEWVSVDTITDLDLLPGHAATIELWHTGAILSDITNN